MLASRMLEIIVAIVSIFVSPDDAHALRSTAPGSYLKTDDIARDHIAATIVVGIVTRTEPADLLAIGHHESRHKVGVITPEGPGWWYDNDGAGPKHFARARFSCGVMTPNPVPSCDEDSLTLVGGYLTGARHLRVWLDRCGGNRICALNGYAGNSEDGQNPGRRTWQTFAIRSAWIRRALRGALR